MASCTRLAACRPWQHDTQSALFRMHRTAQARTAPRVWDACRAVRSWRHTRLGAGTRSVAMVFRAMVFTFIPTALELVLVCAFLARTFTPLVSATVVATFAAYVVFTASMTGRAAAVGASNDVLHRGASRPSGVRDWPAHLAVPARARQLHTRSHMPVELQGLAACASWRSHSSAGSLTGSLAADLAADPAARKPGLHMLGRRRLACLVAPCSPG